MKNKLFDLTKIFVTNAKQGQSFTVRDIVNYTKCEECGVIAISLSIQELRKQGKVDYTGELKSHTTKITKL